MIDLGSNGGYPHTKGGLEELKIITPRIHDVSCAKTDSATDDGLNSAQPVVLKVMGGQFLRTNVLRARPLVS